MVCCVDCSVPTKFKALFNEVYIAIKVFRIVAWVTFVEYIMMS